MPRYQFLSQNGGEHSVEIECPDDDAARKEARNAFREAAFDALIEHGDFDMSMTVTSEGRAIYSARFVSTSKTTGLRSRVRGRKVG